MSYVFQPRNNACVDHFISFDDFAAWLPKVMSSLVWPEPDLWHDQLCFPRLPMPGTMALS